MTTLAPAGPRPAICSACRWTTRGGPQLRRNRPPRPQAPRALEAIVGIGSQPRADGGRGEVRPLGSWAWCDDCGCDPGPGFHVARPRSIWTTSRPGGWTLTTTSFFRAEWQRSASRLTICNLFLSDPAGAINGQQDRYQKRPPRSPRPAAPSGVTSPPASQRAARRAARTPAQEEPAQAPAFG